MNDRKVCLDTANGCSVGFVGYKKLPPAQRELPRGVTEPHTGGLDMRHDSPRVNPLACPLLGSRAWDRCGSYRQTCSREWGHDGPCRWRWS